MSSELDPQPQDYNPESILDQVLGRKEDEVLPWEKCTLPSKGLYYEGIIPQGIVEARPMGLYADKVLSTQRLVRTGQALDYIFKHCVRLPSDFDPLDLLSDDRYFLLYYLRGITHGNEYEFLLTCPYCDKPSQHFYDFNDLWDTKQDPPVDEEGMPVLEPFKVMLPHLSEEVGQDFWVKIRFLRGRDMMDMLGATSPSTNDGMPQRARNRKRRKGLPYDKITEISENLDETLEKNINRIIVEVMGTTDRDKIKQLVGQLHSKDVAAITDFLRDNSPGVDTSIETNCPSCKSIINTPLPITESFFRPKKQRRAVP